MSNAHLLADLQLPDRYEALEQLLGSDTVRVLVPPPGETADALEAIARAVQTKGRGFLCPLWANSGTGKSTLAHSLSHFKPSSFAPSAKHGGSITTEDLIATATHAARQQTSDDSRVIPVVIDGREGEPPREAELAAIKRFTRSRGVGSRSVVLWLETGQSRSAAMAQDYETLAGRPPVKLPLQADGPPRDAWPGIATETLRLANGVASLENLGVDPLTYQPTAFGALGDYLSTIADDFNELVQGLLAQQDKRRNLRYCSPPRAGRRDRSPSLLKVDGRASSTPMPWSQLRPQLKPGDGGAIGLVR